MIMVIVMVDDRVSTQYGGHGDAWWVNDGLVISMMTW